MISDPVEQEHTAILNLLDHLHLGFNSSVLLGDLIDHLSNHFIDEERMMKICNYPERERHINEHLLIQDFVLPLIPRLLVGNSSQEELDLMRERMALHISSDDAKFIHYANTYAPEMFKPL